jgi:mannose-6-phosphate isomerase-like protein (cupin superfamily)
MTGPVIDRPNDETATAWWFLDTLMREHNNAEDMKTVVLEMTLPVGHAPPLHAHEDLDDTWYILEGEMAVQCGDETTIVGAGHWVSMPRGVPHRFRVMGDREARILLVHDNATFRDFVRALARPAESLVVPPDPQIPPIPELMKIGGEHGLTLLGAPMTPDEAEAILSQAVAASSR